MDGKVLERRVGVGLRSGPPDVELIVHVAVDREPFLVESRDGLARELERDRLVQEELPAHGIRHDGALVTDDRSREARLGDVRQDGAEHATGHDDDVQAGVACRRERLARAGAQHAVLADQRPVEIARERSSRARKMLGKVQLCGSRNATRSESCFSLSFCP